MCAVTVGAVETIVPTVLPGSRWRSWCRHSQSESYSGRALPPLSTSTGGVGLGGSRRAIVWWQPVVSQPVKSQVEHRYVYLCTLRFFVLYMSIFWVHTAEIRMNYLDGGLAD